jgi:aspartyl-tRNA(Asn)/glutamyl-tRNA(Gln) amidotransferase subunit A
MELYDLTCTEAVQKMRLGEVSPTEMIRVIIRRIEDTEPNVQAWEVVDTEGALAAARELEIQRNRRRPAHLLFGLPIGIKDVFHVKGLPTVANFQPYRDVPVAEDSGVVRCLREAGAIILGKTVTVQFASGVASPKTRNPWNFDLTPGGSSSGSAAAVASRQVPTAIGTQYGGSTLRPAAFCGVVGLKPTFGRLSRYGLLPASWSLDHVGIFVRSVADAALLLQALAHHDPRDPFSAKTASEDFVGSTNSKRERPRLGLMIDLMERAEGSVRIASERAVHQLAAAGAELFEAHLPVSMELLLSVHFLLIECEQAAIHAEQLPKFAEHYESGLRARLEVGQLLPAVAYLHAMRLRRRFRLQMLEMMNSFDGIIAPTVSTLPGLRSEGTGDATFQSIWTLFGFPNITLPTFLSSERLPHGLQIVGKPFGECTLLQVATWCERVFGPMKAPLVTPQNIEA